MKTPLQRADAIVANFQGFAFDRWDLRDAIGAAIAEAARNAFAQAAAHLDHEAAEARRHGVLVKPEGLETLAATIRMMEVPS